MSTTSDIRIRISEKQKEQLRNLAEAYGYRTISDFVRSRVFNSDLATHSKLNEIIKLLQSRKTQKVT